MKDAAFQELLTRSRPCIRNRNEGRHDIALEPSAPDVVSAAAQRETSTSSATISGVVAHDGRLLEHPP